MNKTLISLALAGITLFSAAQANAGAIHDSALFTGNTLARNDDSSTGLVATGFTFNFNGIVRSDLFVNNNGNVTFGGPLGTYTPSGITAGSLPMLAPFFADVDTRNLSSGVTQYGQGVIGGRNVFGVNWINVGYFSNQVDKLNSFQLIMTDRSDTGAGNFDFEFNYDTILWETGSASSGVNGFGGTPAAAGYTNGAGTYYQFPGSLQTLALLDSNTTTGLIHNSINSNTLGQYIFSVRNGAVVVDPNPTPEPASIALVGLGLAGLGMMRRRKTHA